MINYLRRTLVQDILLLVPLEFLLNVSVEYHQEWTKLLQIKKIILLYLVSYASAVHVRLEMRRRILKSHPRGFNGIKWRGCNKSAFAFHTCQFHEVIRRLSIDASHFSSRRMLSNTFPQSFFSPKRKEKKKKKYRREENIRENAVI